MRGRGNGGGAIHGWGIMKNWAFQNRASQETEGEHSPPEFDSMVVGSREHYIAKQVFWGQATTFSKEGAPPLLPITGVLWAS